MKGTFSIGASVWKFMPNQEICIDSEQSAYIDRGCETIWLSSNHYGREISQQALMSNLYYRVVNVILLEFENQYPTLLTEPFLKPFSDLLLQINETLEFNEKTLFGEFELAHAKWKITNRPSTMCLVKAVGRCLPEVHAIELTSSGGTCTITNSKVEATLWHEIIHAALFQLGQREMYYDEHFVNLFSIFFRQFLKTLKIDNADKQNITT